LSLLVVYNLDCNFLRTCARGDAFNHVSVFIKHVISVTHKSVKPFEVVTLDKDVFLCLNFKSKELGDLGTALINYKVYGRSNLTAHTLYSGIFATGSRAAMVRAFAAASAK